MSDSQGKVRGTNNEGEGNVAEAKRTPFEKRFWQQTRSGYPDECWVWIGTLNRLGYGRIGLGGKNAKIIAAHRASWVLHQGEIPAGMHVLHSCDNRKCVNPAHLSIGTHAENMRDRDAKGRQAKGLRNGRHTHPEATVRGDRHPKATLKCGDVLLIRAAYKAGRTRAELARAFGVSHNNVSYVVSRKTWAHLPEAE